MKYPINFTVENQIISLNSLDELENEVYSGLFNCDYDYIAALKPLVLAHDQNDPAVVNMIDQITRLEELARYCDEFEALKEGFIQNGMDYQSAVSLADDMTSYLWKELGTSIKI